MFKPVPSKISFPELEQGILAWWQANGVFEKSVANRQGRDRFTLYEGPPTANASPGVHHVLSRVFKDVIPRYKTMKGYYAPRHAGWDCHGLPVELEMEKELGLSTKAQIEDYGVEKFNARCRDSVFRYVKQWDALTQRIAFWVDLEHPYRTLDNSYIESGWWIVRQLWDKGLVYQGHRVTPHCPRCGTSLSSHEVALGYQDDVPDPSVYIKFRVPEKVVAGYLAKFGARSDLPTYLLAWTTTPWTLPGNTALAVARDAEYAVAEVESDGRQEQLILAQARLDAALAHPYRVLGTCQGQELMGEHLRLKGVEYEPLYSLPGQSYRVMGPGSGVGSPVSGESFWLIAEDFVSLEDGTGIVHIAPAFGEVDYQAGQRHGLYFVQPVDERGIMTGNPLFEGKFVKEADTDIIADLKLRRLLYRSETIRHTYPFCWRCGTPLLYYAKTSWYIRTTARKDRLISGNREINWYPEHIQEGRFGDWLENNVDWAVSRERYWGTPLPVWTCDGCGHQHCVGSVAELKDRADRQAMAQVGHSLEECLSDLHRPFVDRILLRCPQCRGTMRRRPEVLDAWFDSGAMPVAQWHYPFENQELFRASFPADYICEAVDQTRGWFYTLHALSTLLFDGPCFKNVICLGHILDAKGEKMSKAKGNAVDPWLVLNKHGADALRWYLFTSSPPGNVRRFDMEQVAQVVRQFILTLWNTYSFFVTYANIDRFQPGKEAAQRGLFELDRWILSELNQLIVEVDKRLEGYDPTGAGRAIEEFVDQLSNWYVRRSRRRFWKSENDADKLAAYSTLYHCLVTLSKLLAPFTPFLAEELYQNLVRSWAAKAPESVHLADFPVADLSLMDEELAADTRLAMKLSSLGRAARSRAGIKVRQPLARALVKVRSQKEKEGLPRVAAQVMEELNVKGLEMLEDDSLVRAFDVKPNLQKLGPKYGRRVAEIAEALKKLDPGSVARLVAAGREIEVAGCRLLPDEVLVTSQDRPGFAVAEEAGLVVAVTTGITPELAEEGLARELVHRLQTMRRSAGFDIADYIVTYYKGGDDVTRVVRSFADYIKQETLSRHLIEGTAPDAYSESHSIDGHQVKLAVKRL